MKKFIFSTLGFLLLFASSSPILASSNSISLTMPVREVSARDQDTLTIPKIVTSVALSADIPVTWLLNHDVLSSATSSAYFRQLAQSQDQEFGLILDVTPSIYTSGSVQWPVSTQTGHLLNSYRPLDREKIIDQLFAQYHDTFGAYPTTVGATYIDSYSLSYMAKKYAVKAAVFNLPEYSGGNTSFDHFFPQPYYPSKRNALIPATTRENRIDLVVTFWKPLPLKTSLDDFTTQPLSEYSLTTFGITQHKPLDEQIAASQDLSALLTSHKSSLTKLSSFAEDFITYHPLATPTYMLYTPKYVTYSSPYYTLSLDLENNSLSTLAFYNHQETESFYYDRNPNDFLYLNTYPLIEPLTATPLNSASDIRILPLSKTEFSVKLGNNNIDLSQKSFTTSLDLDIPDHPQYLMSTVAGKHVYKTSSWQPFAQPVLALLFSVLKILVLLALLIRLSGYSFKNLLSLLNKNLNTAAIIIIGSTIWSITTIKSGSMTSYGLSFWGPHSHDATFHLSLIESFKESLFVLNNPNLANTLVKNYHLLYDYLVAVISLVLNIPAIDLYFRILPPIMALLIGILSGRILKQWKYKNSEINLSLMFIYFAGSLGFIPYLIQHGSILGGESMFWIQQNISTLINPPLALSLILLLFFITLYQSWSSNLTPKRILLLTIVGSLLIQAKAYASVLLLVSLLMAILQSLVITRRLSIPKTILLTLLLLVSLILFLPTYSASGSLFHFRPLWFINSLVAAQDRLDWAYAANAWQAYQANGQYLKLFLLHLLITLIYLVGNLGVRIFAFKTWWQNFFAHDTRSLVSWIILIGLAIPFVFIQSGNSWNSIQFSYYSVFFLSFLLGPVIIKFIYSSHKLPEFLVYVMLIIFFSFTTTIATVRDYLSPVPSTVVTHQELRTLDFLKRNPRGMIISPVHNRFQYQPFSAPIPVHASDSTAYISALSAYPSYFADEVNLEIMNYDYKKARSDNQRLYSTKDHRFVTAFLDQHDIKYVYQTPQDYLDIDRINLYLQPLFRSGNYSIYTTRQK